MKIVICLLVNTRRSSSVLKIPKLKTCIKYANIKMTFSLIHSLMQKMFIKHTVYYRHCAKDTKMNKK